MGCPLIQRVISKGIWRRSALTKASTMSLPAFWTLRETSLISDDNEVMALVASA